MKIVALSPHLDDAVFSVGGLLSRLAGEHHVEMHTLLAGGVHPAKGFALACQLDKGLPRSTDYMAIRRREDLAAANLLGVRAVHHGFYEAPNRGYQNAPALFGAVREDDPLPLHLAEVLPDIVSGADLVLAPFGYGDHVDHLIVRGAVEKVTTERLVLWRDLPYADRLPEPEGDWVLIACADQLSTKIEACLAYGSQIGFQFGSPEGARRAISTDLSQVGGEALLPRSATAGDVLARLNTDVTKQSQVAFVS